MALFGRPPCPLSAVGFVRSTSPLAGSSSRRNHLPPSLLVSLRRAKLALFRHSQPASPHLASFGHGSRRRPRLASIRRGDRPFPRIGFVRSPRPRRPRGFVRRNLAPPFDLAEIGSVPSRTPPYDPVACSEGLQSEGSGGRRRLLGATGGSPPVPVGGSHWWRATSGTHFHRVGYSEGHDDLFGRRPVPSLASLVALPPGPVGFVRPPYVPLGCVIHRLPAPLQAHRPDLPPSVQVADLSPSRCPREPTGRQRVMMAVGFVRRDRPSTAPPRRPSPRRRVAPHIIVRGAPLVLPIARQFAPPRVRLSSSTDPRSPTRRVADPTALTSRASTAGPIERSVGAWSRVNLSLAHF